MAISVLVVDDSALMRKVISRMVESSPDCEVVGIARDGEEAVEKVAELRPDVVTLDVEMPRLNGLEALTHIMLHHPTPVVMLSALTEEGSEATVRALEIGAVDFIHKPDGSSISLSIENVGEELVKKIRVAASSRPKRLFIRRKRRFESPKAFRAKVIVFGASTGGPGTLIDITQSLPPKIPPVLVVQHMPGGFTSSFAKRLNATSRLEFKEAEDKDVLKPGHGYVAPGGYHMLVDNSRIRLTRGPKLHGVRPAVDRTMESIASSYENKAIGIVLTGMGSDGAEGLKRIFETGGRTIAEAESSCVVFGMPQAAIEAGAAQVVLPSQRIAETVVKWLKND